jgi:hypothetical protein
MSRTKPGRKVTVKCRVCGLEVAGVRDATGTVRPSNGPHDGPKVDGLCWKHATAPEQPE